MKEILFIDSWGWINLCSRHEKEHAPVVQIYKNLLQKGSTIVTSDYVLVEVITFLFSNIHFSKAEQSLKGLFDAIKSRSVYLEMIGPERFNRAWKLRLKYKDKPKISFTDFTSFIVMKELKIKKVLTHDHHFNQVNMGFELLP